VDYYSIPPFEHLGGDKNCQHYLTVAQWVEQREALLTFYKKRTEEGAKLILDNGVFEFREAYPVEKYLEMADAIGATTIVAPDVWKDAKKTAEFTLEFLGCMSEKELCKFKVMGVPHGRTLSEFTWCYEKICCDVDIVGLAKDEWGDMTGYIRPFFTWSLDEKIPIPFHLLGLSCVKELSMCNQKSVMSFDTSMPYKAGLENKYIRKDSIFSTKYTPEMAFDKEQLAFAIQNCDILRELANEEKVKPWTTC
jgi:hypothetical protein